MSEAGYRILQARANKIRYQRKKPKRPKHTRDDSWDEEVEEEKQQADGTATVRAAVSESDSDQDDPFAQHDDDAMYRTRLARFRSSASAGAASASSQPKPLTPIELAHSYESRLSTLTQESKQTEAKFREVEAKLKQMQMWKMKAMKEKEMEDMQPSSTILPSSQQYHHVPLIERTKLRYYSLMYSSSVVRNFIRNWRTKREVKYVQQAVAQVVKEYVDAKAGGRKVEEEEKEEQEEAEGKWSIDGSPVSSLHPPTSKHSALHTQSVTSSPLSLTLYNHAPTLLGSLTDDTISSIPQNILTPAVNLPPSAAASTGSKRMEVEPQSEVATWLKDAMEQAAGQDGNTAAGGGTKKTSTSGTSPSNTTTTSSTSPSSLHSLLTSLTDSGPILHCLLTDLLSSHSSSMQTYESFCARRQQLENQELKEGEEEMILQEEEGRLLNELTNKQQTLSTLQHNLTSLQSSLSTHTSYDTKLQKIYTGIEQQRRKKELVKRKEERKALRRKGEAEDRDDDEGEVKDRKQHQHLNNGRQQHATRPTSASTTSHPNNYLSSDSPLLMLDDEFEAEFGQVPDTPYLDAFVEEERKSMLMTREKSQLKSNSSSAHSSRPSSAGVNRSAAAAVKLQQPASSVHDLTSTPVPRPSSARTRTLRIYDKASTSKQTQFAAYAKSSSVTSPIGSPRAKGRAIGMYSNGAAAKEASAAPTRAVHSSPSAQRLHALSLVHERQRHLQATTPYRHVLSLSEEMMLADAKRKVKEERLEEEMRKLSKNGNDAHDQPEHVNVATEVKLSARGSRPLKPKLNWT